MFNSLRTSPLPDSSSTQASSAGCASARLRPLLALLLAIAVFAAACTSGGEEIVTGAPVGEPAASGDTADATSDSGDATSDETEDADADAGDTGNVDGVGAAEGSTETIDKDAEDMNAEDMNAEDMNAEDMNAEDMGSDETGGDMGVGDAMDAEPGEELMDDDLDAPVDDAMVDAPDSIEDAPGFDPESVDWIRVEARDDLIDPKRGEILDFGILDDVTIAVRFESAPEGCGGASVFVDEFISGIRIELTKGLPPEAMTRGCPQIVEYQEILVTLAEPLGTRSIEIDNPPPVVEAPVEWSLDDYIGLTFEEAVAMANANGRQARPLMIDGVGQMGTDDFEPRRLNFSVSNGIVIGLTTDAGETAGDTTGL